MQKVPKFQFTLYYQYLSAMSSPIIIPVYSPHRHPRLRYVLKEMGRDLGYDLRLMTDRERWKATEAVGKISISENFRGVNHLLLSAHPFLQGNDPSAEDLRISYPNDVPSFFLVNGEPDYLACCFYHLSRYEEYQPFSADAHGRFPATESHASKNGYLHRPVVREWSALLGDKLRAVFPDLPAPRVKTWSFRPTYDIDILWAYHHRGMRGIASGLRDLLTGHPKRAWKRLTSSPESDPFNSFAFLRSLHLPPGPDKPALAPIWFWLLTNRTDRRDVNAYPVPEAQSLLIKTLAASDTTGIHPGYLTSDYPSVIQEEIKRLVDIIGKPVRHSRQHFLRFRIPETYRALRQAGITHDYSMGYADNIGWRAGTNLPFFWYDLEHEEATGLTVCPFAAMDATLKNHLELDPETAKRRVLELADRVRPFGGEFMLLWHNSSFAEAYGWTGWREAYAAIVERLRA